MLQTQFHTPSFGDEEFDIPGVMHHQHAQQQHPQHPQHPQQHHQLDQYQMHSQMGLMSDQQAAYSQHQWHPQSTPESHMMANQTYHNLHSPTNHSTYHHLSSPNQQMLMMQPPPHQQPPPQQQQQQQQQPPNQHQPQMSPQLSGGNNYIGQSPPQNAPICNENGSTSDDSDDNALNDPNVSCIYIFHNKDTLMKLHFSRFLHIG
jgi:hypothetical protein